MPVVPWRALQLVSLILSGPKFSVCVSLAFSIDFVTETSLWSGRRALRPAVVSGFTTGERGGSHTARPGWSGTEAGDPGTPRPVRLGHRPATVPESRDPPPDVPGTENRPLTSVPVPRTRRGPDLVSHHAPFGNSRPSSPDTGPESASSKPRVSVGRRGRLPLPEPQIAAPPPTRVITDTPALWLSQLSCNRPGQLSHLSGMTAAPRAAPTRADCSFYAGFPPPSFKRHHLGTDSSGSRQPSRLA